MNSQAIHRLLRAGDWPIVTKAASATLTAAELNSVIHTTGATGAVTLTLPSPVGLKGKGFIVFNMVDQDLVLSKTGLLAGLNNAAADTCTFSTSSEKIGASAIVVSNGAKWMVMPIQGTVVFA